MLTHVVVFRTREQSAGQIDELTGLLSGLDGRVPQLRSLSVGADIVRSERSYDVALVATFDSQEDLQAYQVHPEHVKVVERIKQLCDSIVAVDFMQS